MYISEKCNNITVHEINGSSTTCLLSALSYFWSLFLSDVHWSVYQCGSDQMFYLVSRKERSQCHIASKMSAAFDTFGLYLSVFYTDTVTILAILSNHWAGTLTVIYQNRQILFYIRNYLRFLLQTMHINRICLNSNTQIHKSKHIRNTYYKVTYTRILHYECMTYSHILRVCVSHHINHKRGKRNTTNSTTYNSYLWTFHLFVFNLNLFFWLSSSSSPSYCCT